MHLLKAQSKVTYPNFSYPKVFCKATPTISGYLLDEKPTLTVQLADIRVHSAHYMEAEDTKKPSTGKVGFSTIVKATVKARDFSRDVVLGGKLLLWGEKI